MVTLIEPVRSGAALLNEISSTAPSEGHIAVWRLGQAGIVCRFSTGAVVVIDPYLSNHCEAILASPFDHRRLTRSPLDGSELSFATVIACTHDHLDHLDPPTIRSASRLRNRPTLIAPKPAQHVLAELGWSGSDVVLTDDGDEFQVGDLSVKAIAVPHESFDSTADGYPYQGYVFSAGTATVAHLGDSLDHPRVRSALLEAAPDVLFAPINGRDDHRAAIGFAGNMNSAEAVELGSAVGSPIVVPMHYDMFGQNVDDGCLAVFREQAARSGLPHHILEVGSLALIDLSARAHSA